MTLDFLAGPGALATIKRDGLDANRIKAMPGAAGGPKWLILARTDRVIFGEWFKDRTIPVDLIGSSSGAWRFAAAAQADAATAMARMEEVYSGYRYEPGSSARRVREDSQELVEAVVGDQGAKEILMNPMVRLHIMTVRSTAVTSGEGLLGLGLPCALAGIANALSRKSLSWFFRRALFSDARSRRAFPWLEYLPQELPMERYQLTEGNLKQALVASGSIPIVTEGARDVDGAPAGVYRDGGVTDYQFDMPLLSPGDEEGVVFYPHYRHEIVPGWLDKALKWRRASPTTTDRMVLMTPSREYIEGLPCGRIPERRDFIKMEMEERIKWWRQVVGETERLADELREVIAKDKWAEVIRPFP